MMRCKYGVAGLDEKRREGHAISSFLGRKGFRSLVYFQATLLLVLTGFVSRTKAQAGFVTPDFGPGGGATVIGGAPNPDKVFSSDGKYVDYATGAVADALNWNDTLPSVEQVIQNCMNAQLANAGRAQNWPLPLQGALRASGKHCGGTFLTCRF